MDYNNEISAKKFLSEIKKANLSGREFLALVGNSKIKNHAYLELRDNPNLTENRLIELLVDSNLTSDDYYKMLKVVVVLKQRKENLHREKNEEKLKTAIDDASKKLTENRNNLAVLLNTTTITEKTNAQYSPSKSDIISQTDNEPIKSKSETPVIDSHNNHEDNNYDDEETYNNEVEDLEENEEDYFEDDDNDDNDHGLNTSKIVLCLCLGFMLFISSFIIRYLNTGSLLPLKEEVEIVLSQPQTYEELSAIIDGLPNIRKGYPILEDNYYINTPKNEQLKSGFLLNHNDYSFYFYNNTVNVLEMNTAGTGKPNLIGKIEKSDDFTFNSMYLYNNKLFVVYNFKYEARFTSDLETTDENGNIISNKISDAYNQTAVLVEVFSTDFFDFTPIIKYTLDGNFKDVGILENDFYISTHFTPHNTSYQDAPRAFIPSFSIDGNAEFIKLSNIYTPLNNLNNSNMTLVGIINPDNPQSIAVVGGEISDVKSSGLGIYILTENEAVRYDINSGFTSFNHDGTIYNNAIDERNGIVRICVSEEESLNLYILDTKLQIISAVNNIARNEILKGVLFDDKTVYMLAEKLYGIETSRPDEPLASQSISVNIYSDNFYYWSDKERLSVSYEFSDDNLKKGIRLTMYRLEKGTYTETATMLITAESSIDGNWNEYLKSNLDTDKFEIHLSELNQSIIIPISYFNGISYIEKFIMLEYSEYTGFTELAPYINYDRQSDTLQVLTIGNSLYMFMDENIIYEKINDLSFEREIIVIE